MKRFSFTLGLLCSLSFLSLGVAATDSNAPTTTQSTPAPAADDNQILSIKDAITVTVNCPPPSKLIKSTKNIWSYRHFWHSYTASFATNLNTFVLAQWSGSDVGTVICIYKETNTQDPQQQNYTFPVLVYFSGLAKIPTTPNWSKLHGTYKNCIQSDVKKCPFLAYMNKAKKTDYFKDALKLKTNSDD